MDVDFYVKLLTEDKDKEIKVEINSNLNKGNEWEQQE